MRCLSVCLPACLSVCLSVCLYLFISLSLYLSLSPPPPLTLTSTLTPNPNLNPFPYPFPYPRAGCRGNIETSVPGEVIVTPNGVTCIGHLNMPSRMASVSSTLFGNNVTKLLLSMDYKGKFQVVLT